MVRRRKDQPPMKSHTIRMTDAEWAEMQRCAEIADESDSEYIRKAIEMRNKSFEQFTVDLNKEQLKELTNKAKKETIESSLQKVKTGEKVGKVDTKEFRTFLKK